MEKVLVVDDSVSTRNALKRLLSFYDYSVLEAGDVDEAVQVYKEDSPDVIITDIAMPRYLGFELIRWLKEHHESVKIIAMSASFIRLDTAEDLLDVARVLGADGVLRKPFLNQELLAMLGRLSCRDRRSVGKIPGIAQKLSDEKVNDFKGRGSA